MYLSLPDEEPKVLWTAACLWQPNTNQTTFEFLFTWTIHFWIFLFYQVRSRLCCLLSCCGKHLQLYLQIFSQWNLVINNLALNSTFFCEQSAKLTYLWKKVLVCTSKPCRLKNRAIKTLVATSLWLYLLFFFQTISLFKLLLHSHIASITCLRSGFCQMQKKKGHLKRY